jgi:hypothetical protein
MEDEETPETPTDPVEPEEGEDQEPGSGEGNGEEEENPEEKDPWEELLKNYASFLGSVSVQEGYLMVNLEENVYAFETYLAEIANTKAGVQFLANFVGEKHSDVLSYVNTAIAQNDTTFVDAFTFDYEVDYLFDADIIVDPRVEGERKEWHSVTLTGIEHDADDILVVAHYNEDNEQYELVPVANHDGNRVTFLTNSFSPYAVARINFTADTKGEEEKEEDKKQEESTGNKDDKQETSNEETNAAGSVQTGDVTNLTVLYALLILLGLSSTTIVVVAKKRRKE